MSSIVDHSCHALAIDEHRLEFEAAVWTEPRHRKYQSRRAGLVPGLALPTSAADTRTRGLSDLALDWMLKRVCSTIAPSCGSILPEPGPGS